MRHFENEIMVQCRFALVGAGQLEDSLTNLRPVDGDPTTLTWAALQSILNSAANISKLLWGGIGEPEARKRVEARRRQLRKSLGVTYRSPLRFRQMRNAFEHFDEELEKRGAGPLVGRNVGPARSIRIQGLKQSDRLGHFDPSTGRVTFWGRKSVSIPRIVEEVERIYLAAKAQTDTPL
jgi:hypothetical protein